MVALGPLTNIALVGLILLDLIHLMPCLCYWELKWNNCPYFYGICCISLFPLSVTLVHSQNFGPQAIQLDPSFTKNIGRIVILGGAFAVNGNVNPAAEANVSFAVFKNSWST